MALGPVSVGSASYTLPAATASTLGGIKAGKNITIDTDGTASVPDPYPVGSIYQSTDAASPAALFGGTWEQIASDRVLMGASGAHAAATTAEAGLPNITGTFTATQHSSYEKDPTGAFSKTANRGSYGPNKDFYMRTFDISFAASKANAIYGNSDTVQPPAYYVYIWRRVA